MSLDFVDRNKIGITAFEIGSWKASVLREVINKIGENNLKTVCTDGNFAYNAELSVNANIKHVESEFETCLVENIIIHCYGTI